MEKNVVVEVKNEMIGKEVRKKEKGGGREVGVGKGKKGEEKGKGREGEEGKEEREVERGRKTVGEAEGKLGGK